MSARLNEQDGGTNVVVDRAELRRRFAECKGLSAATISETVGEVALDDVTHELLQMCAERVDRELFRTYPTAIRHTMYGDDGIADWIVRYSDDGNTIEPADEATEVHGHVRWERWEDLLRLMHGDVNWMSLFYSLRAIALGEDVFRSHGRYWFMGINFTADTNPSTPGRLMGLLYRDSGEPARLEALVASVGLDNLMRARAETQAATWRDLGVSELLVGSWVRWLIADHSTVAQVTFPDPQSFECELIDADTASADREGGVTIWFATPNVFFSVAGLRSDLSGHMVTGEAKIQGPEARLATFTAATRRMSPRASSAQ